MEVQLTPAERDLLLSFLHERRRELQHQISHASHHDFKLLLREQEQFLTTLIEKLEMARTAAA